MRLRRSIAAVIALIPVMLAGGCGSDSPSDPHVACEGTGIICTAVGTGVAAYRGEGKNPLDAALYEPIDLLFDHEGRLMVLDWNNFRIRRIDQDGRFRTIVGTGIEGPIIEGAGPLETPLHHAFSMALDTAGNLYVAGNHIPQVFEVETNGHVHIAAGSGVPGLGNESVTAAAAEFDGPCGIAVGPSGFPLFIADTSNHRIRRMGSDDIVATVCGNGDPGYGGDYGPSESARLRHPYRVRYNATTGDLYVCDTENNSVRRIDAAGVIHPLAGTGTAGYSGDGGPAAQARLQIPYDAIPGPDGAVWIADTGNNRIRRVDPDGTITTVVGSGIRGFSGDGGDPLAAELDFPSALTFDSDGNLWIADTYNNRVRVCRF